MKNSSFFNRGLVLSFCAISLAAIMPAAGTAFAADVFAVAPEAGVIEKIETGAQKAWPYGSPDEQVVGRRLAFNLYFTDIRENSQVGFADDAPFSAAARARLREVLVYLGENEWGTLDVLVKRSEMDGGGFSAYAGTYYTAAAGFQEGAALYRLRHWAKQSPGVPDMFLMVDFGNIYNFSTNAPGPFQEDFASLLLRVMTHGLGFVSLVGETGDSIIAPNVYTSWDRHLVRGDGSALLAGRAPASGPGVRRPLGASRSRVSGAGRRPHGRRFVVQRIPRFPPVRQRRQTARSRPLALPGRGKPEPLGARPD